MNFRFDVLSKKQKKILNFIKNFKDNFILVGGTAIALQLWHRESIYFDLFIPNQEHLHLRKIKSIIHKSDFEYKTITETDFHYEVIINDVRITWLAYLHNIPNNHLLTSEYFTTPTLLHLWAMKAHAISRRAKRKDYVDLYFLINKYWIEKIASHASNIFNGDFSKKNFYAQLSYFDDIDKSEKVIFLNNNSIPEEKIREFLLSTSKNSIN